MNTQADCTGSGDMHCYQNGKCAFCGKYAPDQKADTPPIAALTARLALASIGSCGCITKTHNIEYHDPMCHYRLFTEVRAELVGRSAKSVDETETGTRCAPLHRHVNELWHWLRHLGGAREAAKWYGGNWYFAGFADKKAPHEVALDGWSYDSVADAAPETEPMVNTASAAPVIFPPNRDAISRQEAWAVISPTTGKVIVHSIRSTWWASALCFYRDEHLTPDEFDARGYRCERIKVAMFNEVVG